jgi:heptosyltransferase-2
VPSEKLLVYLKPRFLGDAVMATPLLRLLKGQPLEGFVLAPPHVQEMLKEDANGLHLLTPGEQRGLGSVWREAARLRSHNFDAALLVNRSFRSALTTFLARIPKRVGHDTEGRRLLLTHPVKYDITKFEAAAYGDLANAMGLEGDFSQVMLTVTPNEIARGKELLDGATVAVQPGASFAEKTLPASGLAEVVGLLQFEGCKVAMIGGKEERPAGDALQALVEKPMLDLIGRTTLRESMGLLASLRAAIGGSTGIMHIAAAVGCPTVTVFGPTDSIRWGHNYGPHRSIQVPSGNINDMDPREVFAAAMRMM